MDIRARLPVAIAVCLALAASTAETEPEILIRAGHWKRAQVLVEARIREVPNDALANFLLSQVRNAFGDRESPLPLAEKAVALDGRTAKFHRQVAECLGVMAQHANLVQQVLLARRFRKEIDSALALDPRDTQAWRDLMEFYLLAPGIIGGDLHKASDTAARIYRVDAVEGLLAQARLALYQKKTAEAEGLLRRASDLQPPSYRARIVLAQFYLSAANLDGAEQQARSALSLDGGRVDAYSVLAEIHAARSEWNGLDAVLSTGAREVPDDLTPYYRAAVRLFSLGRETGRAQHYVRVYLSQPTEGNEPTAAEAKAMLEHRTATGANASLTKGQEFEVSNP